MVKRSLALGVISPSPHNFAFDAKGISVPFLYTHRGRTFPWIIYWSTVNRFYCAQHIQVDTQVPADERPPSNEEICCDRHSSTSFLWPVRSVLPASSHIFLVVQGFCFFSSPHRESMRKWPWRATCLFLVRWVFLAEKRHIKWLGYYRNKHLILLLTRHCCEDQRTFCPWQNL